MQGAHHSSPLPLLPLEAHAVRTRQGSVSPHSVFLEQAKIRLLFACCIFVMCSLAVGWRLVDATLLRSEGDTGLPQRAALTESIATRGDIVDRNGQILATSLLMASAYADSALVLNPEETARKLTKALPSLNKKEVVEKLKSGKRFVWLKRHLSPAEHAAVHRLGLPGIYFQREERRVYPAGSLLSHVIGYTGVDGTGLAGLEKSFDQMLRTTSQPLQISLDARVQHLVRREMVSAIQEFKSAGGAAVVMDAHTGEILALVSLPDFDPHAPPIKNENQLFNRASLGVYEMGSTFKIFNTALALESGRWNVGDSVDATHPIKIGRYSISDFHPEKRWLTVAEVFKHSSNIGSARMIQRLGPEKQQKFLERIGLTHKSPIEIPEVGSPQVPSTWRDINMMTIAFGHGMSVSPIHLASATASMINGGLSVTPTLLKRMQPSEAKRVISSETSDLMRRLMRLVVTEGTAKSADAKGYLVGGKTGTAEKATGKGYNTKALLSSFVGAFPMHDPRYVVFVMLDEPKGNVKTYGFATGGWTAAPVVGRIVSQMGPLFNITPFDANAPDIQQTLRLQLPSGGKELAALPASPVD